MDSAYPGYWNDLFDIKNGAEIVEILKGYGWGINIAPADCKSKLSIRNFANCLSYPSALGEIKFISLQKLFEKENVKKLKGKDVLVRGLTALRFDEIRKHGKKDTSEIFSSIISIVNQDYAYQITKGTKKVLTNYEGEVIFNARLVSMRVLHILHFYIYSLVRDYEFLSDRLYDLNMTILRGNIPLIQVESGHFLVLCE